MCGIAALFSTQSAVTSERLQSANRALRHRGPDSQNVWIDSNERAGLAHARLSLLDLSEHGNQPLTWTRGGAREIYKLIHNGEFYGFEEIKKDLEKKGHRFRTQSDSEILLPLYEEFGTAALSRLRGEFAFVLWDRENQIVFAARDRFGIKPLFYAYHEGSLYFASEVKALFAMGVPAQWDQESVYHYLSTYNLPRHQTLYRNVFQIPPAHYLLASKNNQFKDPEVIPYWDFDYPQADQTENVPFDLEEEVLKYREKLLEAVQLRLRADVPVASYLSGGLDSCSILGMAAHLSSKPIHAFTLSFEDQAEYNEGLIAKEMAAFSNSVFHEIPIRWQQLADNFGEALWQAETPFVNTHGVAKFLLSKAVRDAGFKAVLTGEGSDEILAGYVHFRKDYITHGKSDPNRDQKLAYLIETNEVSRGLLIAKEAPSALSQVQRTLGYIPSFLEAFANGCENMQGLLQENFKKNFDGRDSWKVWLNQVDISRQMSGRSYLNQSLYLWSRTMLPFYLLTVLGDRMEMAHSIEGRLPFLDHKLVEHTVKLPVELKINSELSEKYILREAAKPFVTDTIYLRQKHPFLAPPATTSPQSALFQLVQDVFRSQSFKEHPFIDQKKVIQLLDQIPQMNQEEQSSKDGFLTILLSMEILQKKLNLSWS